MLVFKCFLVFENHAKSLRALTARVRADGRPSKRPIVLRGLSLVSEMKYVYVGHITCQGQSGSKLGLGF